jgi:hypothetical protein
MELAAATPGSPQQLAAPAASPPSPGASGILQPLPAFQAAAAAVLLHHHHQHQRRCGPPAVAPPLSTGCEDHWSWNKNDKSHEVRLYGPKQRIAHFHPNWSNGTAGVRGTRVLNGGRYYWEINVSQRKGTNSLCLAPLPLFSPFASLALYLPYLFLLPSLCPFLNSHFLPLFLLLLLFFLLLPIYLFLPRFFSLSPLPLSTLAFLSLSPLQHSLFSSPLFCLSLPLST